MSLSPGSIHIIKPPLSKLLIFGLTKDVQYFRKFSCKKANQLSLSLRSDWEDFRLILKIEMNVKWSGSHPKNTLGRTYITDLLSLVRCSASMLSCLNESIFSIFLCYAVFSLKGEILILKLLVLPKMSVNQCQILKFFHDYWILYSKRMYIYTDVPSWLLESICKSEYWGIISTIFHKTRIRSIKSTPNHIAVVKYFSHFKQNEEFQGQKTPSQRSI